jgi:hypothetical protein
LKVPFLVASISMEAMASVGSALILYSLLYVYRVRDCVTSLLASLLVCVLCYYPDMHPPSFVNGSGGAGLIQGWREEKDRARTRVDR